MKRLSLLGCFRVIQRKLALTQPIRRPISRPLAPGRTSQVVGIGFAFSRWRNLSAMPRNRYSSRSQRFIFLFQYITMRQLRCQESAFCIEHLAVLHKIFDARPQCCNHDDSYTQPVNCEACSKQHIRVDWEHHNTCLLYTSRCV